MSQGSPSARPAVNAIFSRLVQPEREHASAEIKPRRGTRKTTDGGGVYDLLDKRHFVFFLKKTFVITHIYFEGKQK